MELKADGEIKSIRRTTKFIRIPLIIHSTLKRESAYTLQIEHLHVKRTSISIPKNAIELGPEEIGEYIKETYPSARSFVIQYEAKSDENVPFCAQLFMSGKPKTNHNR